MSLRRLFRRARRHARFNLAVLFTIVVVAYAGVPEVVRLMDALGGGPVGHYEPKDSERGAWLQRAVDGDLIASIPWETVFNITLFLLVAVVWLTFFPRHTSRRPPPS
jgi:hypothetical protein